MASLNGMNGEVGLFCRWANSAARYVGSATAFGAATGMIIVWGLTGPFFEFSDTWQLIINTGTTIITFLMVFLIQNTQNRDSAAIQVKLDEIIRSTLGAHNALLDLEEFSTKDLEKMRALYKQLAEKARSDTTGGIAATGTPGVTA